LQVDAPRMLSNIAALQGLVFAEAVSMHFATQIGKSRAHALLESLSQDVVASGRHLRELTLDALARDHSLHGVVHPDEVRVLFDPAHAAQRAIDVAQPQLAALHEQAQAAASQAPWGEFIALN
jgi:3-carboxy-cis,cis-muconate cycloisomerase